MPLIKFEANNGYVCCSPKSRSGNINGLTKWPIEKNRTIISGKQSDIPTKHLCIFLSAPLWHLICTNCTKEKANLVSQFKKYARTASSKGDIWD